MADTLSVLLKSNTQITLLGQIADPDVGLRLIVERQPDAVIIDANLPDNAVWPLLSQLKTAVPHTRRFVLIHSSQQRKQVKTTGADTISASECNAKKLFLGMGILSSQ